MQSSLPNLVLGYHGCDASVVEGVIQGTSSLRHSNNGYDWLADGVYFWEHNAQRAYEFAKEMARRPHPSKQKIKTPAVVGAVISLGHCLNLLDSQYIALVRQAYSRPQSRP